MVPAEPRTPAQALQILPLTSLGANIRFKQLLRLVDSGRATPLKGMRLHTTFIPLCRQCYGASQVRSRSGLLEELGDNHHRLGNRKAFGIFPSRLCDQGGTSGMVVCNHSPSADRRPRGRGGVEARGVRRQPPAFVRSSSGRKIHLQASRYVYLL